MSTNTALRTYHIRGATEADLPLLGPIDMSAGELFRTVDLDAVADDAPPPITLLQTYLANDRNLWVVVCSPSSAPGSDSPSPSNPGADADSSGDDVVVGFLATHPLKSSDGKSFMHIAQLSIHADHQRRGLGRSLMDHAYAHARSSAQVAGLTLTTYGHVPFNGGFYRALGYEEFRPEAGRWDLAEAIDKVFGTEARELWDSEQRNIERPEMRVWMVRWL